MAYKKLNIRNSKILKILIRRRRLFCILIVLLTVLNLFCFFILPPLLKNLVEKKLSQKINRNVTIDKIRINPYAFSIDIKDLFVSEPDKKEIFCYAKQVFVDINISSIFRFTPVVNEMKIVNPYFNIVREDESLYNFSDLITKDSPSEKPLKFFIGNIVLSNGRIVFSDKPKEKKHFVRNLNLSLPFISNFPAFINTYTSPAFSAEINDSLFALKGKTKLFSDTLETYFDIDISKFSIPEYISYVPVPLKFKLLSAYLEGTLCLSYKNPTKGKQSLSVNGNLLFSDISISGIKDNPVLDVSSVGIGISSIEFFSRQAEVNQINIVSPSFVLVKEKIEELVSNQEVPVKEEKKQKTDNPSFVFNIENIILSDGKFSFTDKVLDTPFHTIIDSVNCDIANLSNMKDQLARFQLSAKSEAEETLSVSGDIGLTPFVSEGKVELDKIIINRYVPYYGKHILFDVVEGGGGISGEYKYFPGENNIGLIFSDLSLSLNGIKATQKDGTPFLETPLFRLLKTDVNIKEKKVSVGSCRAESISLRGTKMKDGTIDFMPLFPKTSNETKPTGKSGSVRWAFSVGNIQLNKSSFYLTDNSPINPAYIAVENLSAKIVDFLPATDKKSSFELFFTLNEKGKISADGHFTPAPLSATFTLDTSDIQVMPIQPYIAEKLNIIVTGGSFSSAGNVSFIKPKDKNSSFVYKGNASVQNFVSVDERYGDTFIKWSKLSLEKMNIGTSPVNIAVEEINLRDFDANVIIYSDNMINVLNAVKKGEPAVKKKERRTSQEKDSRSSNTYIGKIGVKNGCINFIDKSIEPNYFTTIDNLEGNLTGISSIKKEPASLEVVAKIGGDSNLLFTGGLRPLKKDFFLDMKVTLDGMDLTSATPYSGKYLGYATRKGRLALDLDYLIEKNKLQSQNRFIFDQLILGERIESQSATKLPVKFAIALLKDLSGKISLDLPVSGYIDDPKFRIGPVIMKMFVNLITKAAVSPFTLLGAIFGGGEEISYLEYDYGSTIIKPEGEKKLNILVKMLKERPGLNLDIEGFVDKVEDTDVLRQNLFLKTVKMEKLKESVKKGEESISVEDIVLTQEEYQHYLWLAYKNQTFPRPKTVLGQVKEVPVSEMEQLMLEHIKITNDDLRRLATARGEAAKNYLVKNGVASDRVFLLEPKVTTIEKKGQELRASRADFRLK